jgi:molecular chaperone HtpG
MSPETHEFQAEVTALLRLVTNSLYTNREVFLRELVSNASDALDKARFEALVRPELRDKDLAPAIDIVVDAANRIIVVEDTGIGMTRDEAARNLGTIAHSGTLQFLEEARKQGKADVDLIGQFGVGFYSAFMVADEVSVETLSAQPGAEAVRWSSKGDGKFEIAPGSRSRRGTRIELRMKEDASEFLARYRIEAIVRRYSNYVVHPIRAAEIDESGKSGEPRQINSAAPIWARAAGEPSEEEYLEFYKHVAGGFILPGDEPLGRVHFSADAPIQFHALLCVPGRAPADLFMDDRKALQLYARRILVMDDCDQLLPVWLRFMRGVVDSQDLPLNVSREMLQEHGTLAAIRRQLTRKVLKLFEDIAKSDADKWGRIWTEFGPVFKEGLHLDGKHQKELLALCRWRSVAHPDEWISLARYVEAMPADETDLYYIAGTDAKVLAKSPHLESLRARGRDVLLMTDAVDEWVLQSVTEYEGKKFRSVTRADEVEAGEEDTAAPPSAIDPLIAIAKQALGDRVRDVRASKRLSESVACLVDPSFGLSQNMQRILRVARGIPGEASPAVRILELNPEHAIVRAANGIAVSRPDDPRLAGWVELFFDLAALADGQVADPAATVARVQALLGQVVSD